jgi:hypothetical protein
LSLIVSNSDYIGRRVLEAAIVRMSAASPDIHLETANLYRPFTDVKDRLIYPECVMNDSQAQHSATSHNLGGISMARNGQQAGNGEISAASPMGGWTPSRASWLGMAAVVLLAAAVLTIATVVASRASHSDAATMVVDASTSVATSSMAAGPAAIASSWSMGPRELASGPVVSATDVEPETASSSLVYSPR